MKAIILAISLFFVVNHAQGKSPVMDETVSGPSFNEFQEKNFKVQGLSKSKSDWDSNRNPSSDEEEKSEKAKEADPVTKPWPYEE